jgi:hypothetical protein
MPMFNRNLTLHWSGTEVNAIVDSKFTSVRSILPLCRKPSVKPRYLDYTEI